MTVNDFVRALNTGDAAHERLIIKTQIFLLPATDKNMKLLADFYQELSDFYRSITQQEIDNATKAEK